MTKLTILHNRLIIPLNGWHLTFLVALSLHWLAWGSFAREVRGDKSEDEVWNHHHNSQFFLLFDNNDINHW